MRFQWKSVLLLYIISSFTNSELECQNFSALYGDGETLCNTMWGGAFVYTNMTPAYTMWFFSYSNPNEDINEMLNISHNDVCLPGYNQKVNVSAEGPGFTECHPWKEASCCKESVMGSVDKIIQIYGDEWRWDRCGELSQACERFFVQEACFYECEPSIALWKKYPLNHSNVWEIDAMPIRADYCDAWFTACAADLFCANGNGSFYSCSKVLPTEAPNERDVITLETESKADAGLIVGVVVAIIFVVTLCVVVGYMRYRERKGKPLFETMLTPDEQAASSHEIGSISDVTAGINTVGGTSDLHDL